MTVLLALSLTVSAGIMAFYVWYLTWPVVEGIVLKVNEGVSQITATRSPSRYRLMVYEFEYGGTKSVSTRQGLIVTSALAPKKQKGDPICMSVCQNIRSWSCPRRPVLELLSCLTFIVIVNSPVLILMFLY